jgi:hypothetical protein
VAQKLGRDPQATRLTTSRALLVRRLLILGKRVEEVSPIGQCEHTLLHQHDRAIDAAGGIVRLAGLLV